ncbi:MAG: 50S ribosomal protein L13 [Candidatus Verstraetearchaeota archaeon]|nr:50S ribosomal protein L13 [Candidatus Verstraetearchaeota archaeon]
MSDVLYIDGKGLRLGRAASKIAKQLMSGKRVVVVNVEKVVVSGDKESVKSKYERWMTIRTLKNPEEVGMKQHRSPDRLFHSAVKNMLPKTPSGKDALKRLKVYMGIPPDLSQNQFQTIENVDVMHLRGPYMELGEVSKSLGWSVQ